MCQWLRRCESGPEIRPGSEKKDWKDVCEYEEALNESVANQAPGRGCATYPLSACGASEILDV